MYAQTHTETEQYAKCIEVSKRIRWDIDTDLIRGRHFDLSKKFLPDGLSKVDKLDFLSEQERIFFSQVQGRTYANTFGLVERFINAKVLEVSRDHWLGNQVALEALVRFSDEELKHQEMFRRLDAMMAEVLPAGYEFTAQADSVASVVLSKSSWAVLGLTLHIELFTQEHYKQSIAPDDHLSDLFKDVFLFHWQEESQHAKLDELEWMREDDKLSDQQREQAVSDLIDLVVAVDQILQQQSKADTHYFVTNCDRLLDKKQVSIIADTFLEAYRWQYIVSGIQIPKFIEVLSGLTNEPQIQRIQNALAPLVA